MAEKLQAKPSRSGAYKCMHTGEQSLGVWYVLRLVTQSGLSFCSETCYQGDHVEKLLNYLKPALHKICKMFLKIEAIF